MITNSSTLLVDDPQDIFNHCFDYVQTMVNSRMEGNYEWLLDEGEKSSLRFNQFVGFYPDYFTFKTMGRSVFERGLNLLSHRFGVQFFSYRVMLRFISLFYDLPLFSHAPHKDWLCRYLKNNSLAMNTWTLVEFFLFMERWMRGVVSVEFMRFESVKHHMNELSINALSRVDFDLEDISELALSSSIMAACYANWLDIIVPDVDDRLSDVISKVCSILVNSSNELMKGPLALLMRHDQLIMYECDNSGEIIFDLVVVLKMILLGHRVVLVGKYAPILNDVTVQDIYDLIHQVPLLGKLKQSLINGQLRLIYANDFPMAGKYLPLVTDEYRRLAVQCDFFWLKGQANFQTMPVVNHGIFKRSLVYKKPIVLNFIVKAPIVRYCLDQSRIGTVNIGDPLVCLV